MKGERKADGEEEEEGEHSFHIKLLSFPFPKIKTYILKLWLPCGPFPLRNCKSEQIEAV